MGLVEVLPPQTPAAEKDSQADIEKATWAGMQEIDCTHPAFTFHAERAIRKIVSRYADHPEVIGYQVDNEPGMLLFHNHGVFQRFLDELRQRYGTVQNLNDAWGLVYWSHKLTTWSDLWRPDGNFQPQYDLAWHTFQAKLTTEFVGWQADPQGWTAPFPVPLRPPTWCAGWYRMSPTPGVSCLHR